MRKSLVIAACFAVSLSASAAAAASVFSLVATRQSDSLTWSFSLYTPDLPVAALGVTVPATVTSFVINPANAAIAPFGGSTGSYFGYGATGGRFVLGLNPVTCSSSYTACTPFATNGEVFLGTFLTPTVVSTLGLGPDDSSIGGTVFDVDLSPYDTQCQSNGNTMTCVVVPEPSAVTLLGLAAFALRLTRRG